MGYRLDITNKEETINYYGTKHYGYSFQMAEDGAEEFESIRYLIELGKIDPYECFFYCSDIEIELTADEFEHFIKLYSKEWEDICSFYADWAGGKTLLDNEDIQKLLKDKGNKILSWG